MAATDVTVARGAAADRLAYPVPARRRRVRVDTGRIARRGAAGGLIVLMALGSFALWTAIPLGGLWLASQLTGSITRLEAAPALAAVAGIPLAMVIGAAGLARIERCYMRLTGITRPRRVPAYRRSFSDSHAPAPASLLEGIMVVSALVAAIALVGWFFLLAGSPLPAHGPFTT